MEWLPPPQPAVATAPTTIVDPVTGEELPVHGDDDAPATSETCLPCRISKVHIHAPRAAPPRRRRTVSYTHLTLPTKA